jgi:hypothetical protein
LSCCGPGAQSWLLLFNNELHREIANEPKDTAERFEERWQGIDEPSI